jgi:predicted amidohydrolase
MGRVRLLLAAIECAKGDIYTHLATHVAVVEQADKIGARAVVFPEMSLTGSVDPRTHPERLVDLEHPALERLVDEAGSTTVVFGIAERQTNPQTQHITQVVAQNREIVAVQRKRYLGEGEEAYTAATGDALFHIDGHPTAIVICAEAGHDPPWHRGAELILFCAAPGLYGRRTDQDGWQQGYDWWADSALTDARKHALRGVTVAIATQAGSTEDEDFPGLAALVSPGGVVVAQLADWRPGLLAVDVSLPHSRPG